MTLGPPDMSATVRRFSYPVTRWRYPSAPTVNAQGYAVQAYPTSSQITAHIHPAPGKVLQQLPEGHTGKAAVVIYTADEVQIGSEETQVRGDLVEHDGRVWEVIQRGQWTGKSAGASTYLAFVAVEVFDRLAP